MVEPTHECSHYQRNCHVQASCCSIFYPCKLCHDELYKGHKADWCRVERMEFEKVPQVKCLECQTVQEPAEKCSNCGIQFGVYSCLKCRLYENNPNKDDCGMCRRGKQNENKHCHTCGYCMHISTYDEHVCKEKKVESNCPICLENLKYSTKYCVPMKCGHLIHDHCLKEYVKTYVNCPVCGKSLAKMGSRKKRFIEQAIKQTKDQIPEELKSKKVNILCHECMSKTNDVPFHFYGMKCGVCGTYNTKVI